VREADQVKAEPLMEGSENPHDILAARQQTCRNTWSTRSRRSTGSRA
jgi:hypothetical protein